MKKLFSMFLVLMMVLGLFAAVSGSALAAGDVTVLFTADIGTPAEGGITYDAVAALKQSFGSALLVDAGGYSADSVSAMNAAGYDLAAAVSGVSGANFTEISLADSSYNGGAALTCNGNTVAFVSLSVPSGSDTASYYESVQSIVDQALSNGVSYVVGIGTGIDAYGVAANVTGIDAILTSGSSNGAGSVSRTAAVTDTEETEETEDGEEAVDGEEEPVQDSASESETLVAYVGSDFAGVGVLSLSSDSVSYSCRTADDLRDAGLLDAEETAEEPVEEEAAEEADTVESEETEEQTDDAAEPAAQLIDEESADDTENDAEEPAEEDEADPVAEAASGTDLEESPVSGSDAETPDNNGDDADTPDDTGDDTADDTDESKPLPDESDEQDSDADETDNDAADDETDDDASSEPTATPVPTAPADTTVTFTKGTTDLTLSADKTITAVNFTYTGLVNNVATQITSTLGSQYYTINDKQVTIQASCLNSWGNGTYTFNLKHADGTTTDVKVKISGTAPANTSTNTGTTTNTTTPTGTTTDTGSTTTTGTTTTTTTTTGTTTTPATATPAGGTSATPAAATVAPTSGSTTTSGGILSHNPLTGDTTQILPWVIGLVVLAAAMVVVVVILSKRQKRR